MLVWMDLEQFKTNVESIPIFVGCFAHYYGGKHILFQEVQEK